MNHLIFGLLGGIIGWGLSRMTQAGLGSFSVTIVNVLTGFVGALATGWFLVPLLAESGRSDFSLTASLVALGSLALLTVATLTGR